MQAQIFQRPNANHHEDRTVALLDSSKSRSSNQERSHKRLKLAGDHSVDLMKKLLNSMKKSNTGDIQLIWINNTSKSDPSSNRLAMKAGITKQSQLAGQENSQEPLVRSTCHFIVSRMRKIFRAIRNGIPATDPTLVYPSTKISLTSWTLTATLLMLM